MALSDEELADRPVVQAIARHFDLSGKTVVDDDVIFSSVPRTPGAHVRYTGRP